MYHATASKKLPREIFLDALETEPDIRATFVEHECRGDAALCFEVNALLGVHDEPDSFLDSPRIRLGLANDAQTNRADSDTCQELRSKSGTQIGPYKLLEKIGEGGFGTVYRADQTEPVHRRVALKIIKLGMDTRQVIARFEAERQARR